jgi:putative membrane protein
MSDEKTLDIFSIERPHPNLLKLYFIRSLLVLPLFPIVFPPLFFRYHTLRYHFDEEGIGMRWGILFRREINLTYSRIQDIHVHAGLLQRWLGLADLKIQTASGSAAAEMVIEGVLEYEALRDYLYTKMRGYREPAGDAATPAADASEDALAILKDIADEIRKTREALEKCMDS